MVTMVCCRVVLLLLFAITCAPSQTFGDAEKHQVIVVGAGAAGFTATAVLLEHNVTDILVLEASDRIGGRIHTVQFGGVPIDKGAEFIHGEKGNVVFEMVSPHNLLVSYMSVLHDNQFLFVNTSGHVFNSTFVKHLIDEAYAILYDKDVEHFNGSVADNFTPRMNELLRTNNVSLPLGEALHHLVPLLELSNSPAENLSQLGAWGNTQYLESEGDQTLKWKTGGYSTIFDFISKKYPNPSEELPVKNKVMFEKQVTRVNRNEEGVEIKCADGSSYLAEHVIVTLSLGVLKKQAATMFNPPLSADRSAAIESLGFGDVAKVFLLFPTRWWPNNTNIIIPLFSQQELQEFKANSSHGSWTSYITGFHPVMNHNRMLCVWLSGEACRTMEALTEDQVVEGLMELLQKALNNTFDIPKPESILRSNWASNPLTLGSYSYRTVDSDLHNHTNTMLSTPIFNGDKPVILFAGEATHTDYWSTVHGALASGRREALNVIDYLNKSAQT